MDTVTSFEALRNSVLTLCPVHEKSLKALLDTFTLAEYPANSLFCKAGDYAWGMAYVSEGIFISYYSGNKSGPVVKDIFVEQNFMLPLPSFIYRSPSHLNFQTILPAKVLQARYSVIDTLSRDHPSVNTFVRTLVDREWIIRKAVQESSQFHYNMQSRYRMLEERLGVYIRQIPDPILSSYLGISEKQFSKLRQTDL
jgi:CRP-like cAMP-binding protein